MRTIIVLLMLIFPLRVLAEMEDFPRYSHGALLFYMDSASFPNLNNKEKTYVEFYYGIPFNQLTFKEKADTLFAYCILHTLIKDENGKEVCRISDAKRYYAFTEEEIGTDLPLLLNKAIELTPGKYSYKTTVQDGNSEREGYIEGEMEIPDYSVEELTVSQIQFASQLFKPLKESPFLKNGVTVIPNVSRTYSYKLPMLYFYFEINNILTSQTPMPDSTTLAISYEVYNPEGKLMKSFSGLKKTLAQNSSAEIGGFNIITLPPDNYRLRIIVEDLNTQKQVVTERGFRFLGMEEEAQPVAEILTEKEAEEYLNQIRYIATPEELKIYKSLPLDKKAEYLREFWKRRDPTPGTAKNEAMLEHYRRWYFVQKRYSSNIPGWKTDRGRIYIKYGPPDEIERHSASFDTKPYEIWYYYKKNMRFIFADLQGFGRYTLIHSVTMDHTEIEDPYWERRIKIIKGREF